MFKYNPLKPKSLNLGFQVKIQDINNDINNDIYKKLNA